MKNIISLLMILSFMTISFSHLKVNLKEARNKNLYHKRINEIKKATVMIIQYLGDEKFSFGSGFLLYIKETNTSFIMTNAHVCINDFPKYVKDKNYREKTFPQKDLKLNIQGKTGFHFVQTKGSNLGINYKQDVCLIPVNKKDFSKKDFAFIDSRSKKEVIDYAKEKENSLMLFTLNHAQKGEVLIKKGFFKEYETPRFQKLNDSVVYFRDEGALSTIDIIPGDSGSAIVDKNLNLVGIAYGSEININFFQRSGDSRKDLEFCLQKNNIKNKRDLAFIKSDISEIDGAFFPLAFLKN